jgi:U1 small nuclear ribonucleoprotein
MFSECCFSLCFNVDDPHTDPNISGDPYKTLFVARLVSYIFQYSKYGAFSYVLSYLIDSTFQQSYETTESRIKREFESYGAIKRVGILNMLKRVR